jgi:hypothetical protein
VFYNNTLVNEILYRVFHDFRQAKYMVMVI